MPRAALPPDPERGRASTLQARVGCEFSYTTDTPVPMLMLVQPRVDGMHDIVRQSRWLRPAVPLRAYADSFGNTCWRFTAPGGPITIHYEAIMAIDGAPDPVVVSAPEVPVQDLPDDTLVFTLPSRAIESDRLLDIAWDLFGQVAPGWPRVQAICDWVHDQVRFQVGSTTPTTTAFEVYERRVGVCRDFALLAIAFCRALNIPARYTFGYLPDIGVAPPDAPMDFHTWFEAFLGDRWFTFDARHNVPRIGRVVIGRGRDAVDVALTTSYGAAKLENLTVWADQITPDPAGRLSSGQVDALGHMGRATRESDVIRRSVRTD